ncbi:MAG: hypothetical protein ACE5IY_21690 [bacterium]
MWMRIWPPGKFFGALTAALVLLQTVGAPVRGQTRPWLEMGLLHELSAFRLDLDTPINPNNRILPQPTWASATIADLAGGLGPLRATLNLSASRTELSAMTYEQKVRELYLSASVSEHLDVTLGRRILKWGAGYAFNPTGVVEPVRDPADPEDRLRRYRGRNLVALSAYFGELALDAVYVNDALPNHPANASKRHELAVRAYLFWNGADLSAVAHFRRGRRLRWGGNYAQVFGANLEVHAEMLLQVGSSRWYPLFVADDSEPAFYPTWPYVQRQARSVSRFPKILLGGQYTFPWGTNLILEFYHDRAGLSQREWQRWYRFVQFHSGQASLAVPERFPGSREAARGNLLWSLSTLSGQGAMRSYGFLRLADSGLLASASASAFVNLHDWSGVGIANACYRVSNHLAFYFRISYLWGSHSSEFGVLFNDAVVNLGVRGSF